MGSRSRKKLTARQEAALARVRGKSGKFAAKGPDAPLPRSTLGARAARAREVASGELVAILGGGGTVDPDDHLYRSTREGIRDLPRYTHERQIELAFGLYSTDPLAKFIVDCTVDHVVGQGLEFKVDPTDAEVQAEQAKKASEARAKAAKGAAAKAAQDEARVKALVEAGGAGGDPAAMSAAAPTQPKETPPSDAAAKEGEPDVEPDVEPTDTALTDPVAAVQADLAEAADPRPEPDPETAEAAASFDPLSDIEPTADELTAVLAEHWRDPDNNWPIKARDRATGLGLWGEQLWPAFVAPSTGRVKLGRIDPRRIDYIRTDPENDERATHAVLQTVVDNTGSPIGTGAPGGRARAYRIVAEDEGGGVAGGETVSSPMSAAAPLPTDLTTANVNGQAATVVANGAPAGTGAGAAAPPSPSPDPSSTLGYLTGDAFYFTVNKVQGAKRGHSDIFHLIDWIDALGNLMFDMLDAAKAQRSFIFDVLLKGATPAAIKAWQREHSTPPRSGAVRVHNESETWTPISPELKGSDHAEFVRVFRAHILGGAGIPEHWYGQGDVVNRAGGDKTMQPAMQRLEARRTLFFFHVESVLRFVVDQAILAGRFGRTPGGRRRGTPQTKNRVHVTAPEIQVEDVTNAAAALAQGVSALTVAEDRKWITRDTARAGFASIASHAGVDVDPKAEKAAVDAQEEGAGAGAGGTPLGGDDPASGSENAALRAALAQSVGARGVVPVGGVGARAGNGPEDADDESHAQETMRSAQDALAMRGSPHAAPEEEVTRDEFRAEMATFKAEFLGGLLTQAQAQVAQAHARDLARESAPPPAPVAPPAPPPAPMFALPGAVVTIPDGATIRLDATPGMLDRAAESAAAQATDTIVAALDRLTLAAQAGNAGVAEAIAKKPIPVSEPAQITVQPSALGPIHVAAPEVRVDVAAPAVTVTPLVGELVVKLEAPAREPRTVELKDEETGATIRGTVG